MNLHETHLSKKMHNLHYYFNLYGQIAGRRYNKIKKRQNFNFIFSVIFHYRDSAVLRIN